jgi:hypothetical protein
LVLFNKNIYKKVVNVFSIFFVYFWIFFINNFNVVLYLFI